MPKKHRQTFLEPNTNHVHPSSNGGKSAAEEKPQVSVNERLSQLRLAQASPASAERKRELAELSNQKSLPPGLGQVLGLRTSAPPKPKPGFRNRIPIRMRTPGPAPPPSWGSGGGLYRQALQAGYYAAKPGPRKFGKRTAVLRTRPEKLARFLFMIDDCSVKPGSLTHATLRTSAENWDAIMEDCYDFLDYLPIHLRIILLSYLSTHGPEEGIDMESLQALFPRHADITCLDLSGLAGWSFTVKELKRWLTKPEVEATSILVDSGTTEDDVAESWEDVVSIETPFSSIPSTLKTATPFFTKLSLAYPSVNVSWNDLLSLSKELHTLTHLSLAHWPLPTRTPNMKTSTYVSKAGPEYSTGGTSLYSASDKDYEESAVILRLLSENTYSLRWLDLESCSDWLGALITAIPPPTSTSSTPNNIPRDVADANWELHQRPRGPDWTTSWRNITYLNLQQAPSRLPHPYLLRNNVFRLRLAHRYRSITPKHIAMLQEYGTVLSASLSASDVVPPNHCLSCHPDDPREGPCSSICRTCEAYQENAAAVVARWLERESEARAVGRTINRIRTGAGIKRCILDHGWLKGDGYR